MSAGDSQSTSGPGGSPRLARAQAERASHRGRARRPRQGGPAGGAADGARGLGAGGRPARPDRASRGTGRDPRARARPDPLRADARVALRVLPRRGARHGGRPVGDAALGHQRPALRRRPPVELRALRLARAADPLRHQRLRRDASRAMGMGREAPCRERRGARPRARLLRLRPARHGHGRRPRVPARDAARGAARDARGLVRPHGRRAGDELGPHRGRRPTGSARRKGSRRRRTSPRPGPATA